LSGPNAIEETVISGCALRPRIAVKSVLPALKHLFFSLLPTRRGLIQMVLKGVLTDCAEITIAEGAEEVTSITPVDALFELFELPELGSGTIIIFWLASSVIDAIQEWTSTARFYEYCQPTAIHGTAAASCGVPVALGVNNDWVNLSMFQIDEDPGAWFILGASTIVVPRDGDYIYQYAILATAVIGLIHVTTRIFVVGSGGIASDESPVQVLSAGAATSWGDAGTLVGVKAGDSINLQYKATTGTLGNFGAVTTFDISGPD
jgi:hypothetical protein